jgi:hypothetical protein
MTTIHRGHDVAYLTGGHRDGGCSGAMAYYTASGEPPGVWAGKGAAKLGLSGEVDARVMDRLYMGGITEDGEILASRRQSKQAGEREDAAVALYLREHPYASAVEVAEVRAAERGKDPHTVPYFDVTVDLVKSVSVLHASYRVSAKKAREDGDTGQAAALDAKADEIEQALVESAREAVAQMERDAAYTRTGHHSATSGEYRDGDGLIASVFLHHISRDGDPHLHVHIAVDNLIQRADGADDTWRTLDSRALHDQRLKLAALTDRIMETKLTRLGHVMVPRLDGNGAEVGGIGQDVMDLFSSRRRALTPELKKLISQYVATYGRQPNKRTIWLLGQQAAQNTRRPKAEARRRAAGQTGSTEPTEAERLAAWETQTTAREVQALSQVHQGEAAYAAEKSARPREVLDDDAKRRVARVAVAEVQTHHAVWSMANLWFEIHRALPVLPASTDVRSLLTEIAKLAVSGRAGADVVQVTAPDVTDVTSLGVRRSDGGSIYRRPQEDRYTTLAHLDTEEQILTTAGQPVAQLVTGTEARAAVAGTDLNAEQAAAVVAMLTATTRTTTLVAPAGAGKSHTMAVFAALWELLTGGRVIGLTTSTNASRVLVAEGLTEAYNIAEFLGKIEGSDELRHPVQVLARDVLVIDEATQVSTADMAMIQETARQAGARDTAVGDTQQLGAVDAGGMFRLLAKEIPAAELTEVRRFTAPWEADASVRLRLGDFTAVPVYDRHGRIRAADHEAACDRAASQWLADHLRGKDVLLLAGSNEEAADLARRVQAKLIEHGKIGAVSGGYLAQAPLADGNTAHPGDLIRARLNTDIDAAGRKLANRDTLKITGIRGAAVEARRQQLDGTWTERFWLPTSYLASSAELGYAGNVHVAQGRTVDTTHLVVTDTLSRQSLYVGMSRGREANTAHVITGNTAPDGHEPYEQTAPEAVLKNVMDRDDTELSAIEAIREGQEWATGTGHLLNLYTAAVQPAMHAAIDQHITAMLDEHQAARYQREPARQALHAALRAARLSGHDVGAVIDQITAAPLDGLRSVSAGLHGRLRNLNLAGQASQPATWADRTPNAAPDIAHEIAGHLDNRAAELGRRHATNPQPWLVRHLGSLRAEASPMEVADYEGRAGFTASYREAAGITGPDQAISPGPHHGNPELEHMRQRAIRDMEIKNEAALWAHMDRGQLEAHQAAAARAQATAPPDVADQLRATVHAETDAQREADQAHARGNHQEAQAAERLAGILAAQRGPLEPQLTEHDQYAEQTRTVREQGDKATTELNRRGHQPAKRDASPHAAIEAEPSNLETSTQTEPRTEAQRFSELADNVAAVGRALDRQHQTAIQNGQPWPPQPRPETEAESGLESSTSAPTEPEPGWLHQLDADMTALTHSIAREHPAALDEGLPWPPVPTPAAPAGEADHHEPSARITEAIRQAADVAHRATEEKATRQAHSDYAARISREAEGQPETHASMTGKPATETEIEL